MTSVWAKYEPKEISNIDLRGKDIIFKVEDNDGNFLCLEKTTSNHYYLNNGKEPLKMAYQKAQELDQQLVQKFIHIKYRLPAFSGKNCSLSHRMTMRGETTKICKDENSKLKTVKEVKSLMNKFLK